MENTYFVVFRKRGNEAIWRAEGSLGSYAGYLEGVDKETAQELIEAAHQVCPYSKATRGNIEVTLKAV